MEKPYVPIVSNQLFDPSGFSNFDLNYCCSDLIVTFGKSDRTKSTNSIYDASFFQFLDDPHRGFPLCKIASIIMLAPRIRFSFHHPDTKQCNSPIYLSNFGVGLSDILLHDCSFFEEKFPLSEACIHCLVKNNYSDWCSLFPILRKLTFFASALLIKYSDFLSKYDDALNYDDVFTLSCEPDASGFYKGIVGETNFISFGDIGIEKRYWKVFWLAVARKYPGANRKIWFSLQINLKHGPIDAWRVQMNTMIKYNQFSRFVMVPFGCGIWGAIVYLFAHAPPSSESCKVFPIDAFN